MSKSSESVPGPKQTDFVFANGCFKAANPMRRNDQIHESASLEEIGFICSQVVGDEAGLHYELYEHDGLKGWAVLFHTAGLVSCIYVHEWPDLIELLAKLSTIALAGVLTDADSDGKRTDVHLPVSPVKPIRCR